MRTVIKGKIYDTDKAKRIDDYGNNLNYDLERYYLETLYQKRTGEYFLLCEKAHQSSIVPMNKAIAETWLKKAKIKNVPVEYLLEELSASTDQHTNKLYITEIKRRFNVKESEIHDLSVKLYC